ncbi:MAG: GGDEF domain-containing protein [Sedimentisphaerales bacterium]|nr:GGDEF domain-containing protein [Sedimentisphaerales bacterium]
MMISRILLGLAMNWPLLLVGLAAFGLGLLIGRSFPLAAARRLLEQVRAARREGQSPPPDQTPPGLFADIEREFADLFTALQNSRGELDQMNRHVNHSVVRRTEKLERNLQQMKKTALTDTLTGLANRKFFEEYLEVLFHQSCREERDLACMMIDMDGFKQVNDTLGHATGDNLIAFLGNLLRAAVRDGDMCCRLGGDEFVVLLESATPELALEVSERIRRLFEREAVHVGLAVTPADRPMPLPAVSIGLAGRLLSRAQTPQELLECADRALLQAKAAGKNRIVVYRPEKSNGLRANR